ncbi:hypothetical protein BO85DRAFT_33834 [Aspergillus piperis CBS 112811]|uniref:Uncharacterized protein n=1 Tax=Aspergillus piperis CBS 112811 TaxID=1448313 RepID=A0A8G1R0Y0_9EURO|nr:hypothetical protein BO85DRAFT_33834 [Aspergillus piperis CBS 112811]RAH57137.1 hypothetical protein BO85DRAFT_33834 [Aspergillus piperis CBS 112811]
MKLKCCCAASLSCLRICEALVSFPHQPADPNRLTMECVLMLDEVIVVQTTHISHSVWVCVASQLAYQPADPPVESGSMLNEVTVADYISQFSYLVTGSARQLISISTRRSISD